VVPLVTDLFIETKQSQLFFVRFDLLQSFVQLGFARFDPAFAMDCFPTDESDDEDDGGSVCKDTKVIGALLMSVCAFDILITKRRQEGCNSQVRSGPAAFQEDGVSIDEEDDRGER
jgi:hypothetical protein